MNVRVNLRNFEIHDLVDVEDIYKTSDDYIQIRRKDGSWQEFSSGQVTNIEIRMP